MQARGVVPVGVLLQHQPVATGNVEAVQEDRAVPERIRRQQCLHHATELRCVKASPRR